MKAAVLLFFSLISFGCSLSASPVFIRASQVGYLPGDIKTAIVFSEKPFKEKSFSVINVDGNKKVFEGAIPDSGMQYGNFDFCYSINFTDINTAGSYIIKVGNSESFPFKIGETVFNHVADSLMLFYKVQRCGPTNPLLHDVCHLYDVVKVIGYHDTSGIDVTGGWHDAGDYIKFLSTTAYTTYMLIFAYEFDPVKFGFDNDNNNVPDVLEEAKIGLDWMLRSNFKKDKLVTQVQDLRDHNVGWRLPENDTLKYERTGYVGIGKNQIGLYAATMSIAARVWSNLFQLHDFADKCLTSAENLYSLKDDVPDVDVSQSGFYQDNKFWGKLALGAAELYLTTKNEVYLTDAIEFADSAESDFWWSWGNMNSLAHYRLAKFQPRFGEYILNNLNAFNSNKGSSPFGVGLPYSWGSTNTFLGITLQSILYKNLTGVKYFDTLAVYQRDYVLGKNPYGITFIHNIGSKYPEQLHSQVGYFNGGYLPGALSAGPAPVSVLNQYKIVRENDKYAQFNTDSLKYYDDRNDYITNEPAIISNATALFVYGYYSRR